VELRRGRDNADLSLAQLARRAYSSKATVSRWLSGQALPDQDQARRWTEVCGTDTATMMRLWAAAAAIPATPESPQPLSAEQEPAGHRRRFRRGITAIVAAAALLIAASIIWALHRDPLARPGALGNAQITSVTPAGGSSCIGDIVQVNLEISVPASADRQLWLLAVVRTGTPNKHLVYYAKHQLTDATGQQTTIIPLIGAAIGSVRNLVVVSSAHRSFSWLRQNLAHDGIPSWDIKRVTLPSDVREVSPFYKVKRQC
jgi:transcriptional regulator with XRE-family HTH domain